MKSAIRQSLPKMTLMLIVIFLTLMVGTSLISGQQEDTAHTSDTATHQTAEKGSGNTHGESEDHLAQSFLSDQKPIVIVLFELVIFILVAKLGGEIMERIRQPAVLGELIVGMIIGNLALIGITEFEFIKHDHFIELLAEIGVLILLFEVGLETDLGEMLSVGTTSFLVAVIGVVAPFILGWGVAAYFLPEASHYVHIFIGATLCATSVGITARVIKDIRRLQTREAKIVLGAAVIDDIMGLIVLAIVSGLISAADTGQSINSLNVLFIFIKAVAFVVVAILVGNKIMPSIFLVALNLKGQGILLGVALFTCFTLAASAEMIGLAGIVGAFAAGVIMEKVHYQGFTDRGEHSLDDLIYPLSTFLVPIFFVHMGLKVDLATFGDLNILVFAGVLTLVAIIGKQACSLGVLEKGINKASIGIGMIPRGEVGLIFAKIGHGLTLGGVAVISDSTYSAVVIMVILTTLVTPPILKRSLLKKSTDYYAVE